MNKIILEEEEVFDYESNHEEVQAAADNSAVTSAITELIKKVWELIDTVSESTVNLSALGNENITSILKDITTDEYIHIGQLEKVLDFMIPEATAINSGEDKADETLEEPAEEPEVAEEPVEEPVPEVEEPEEEEEEAVLPPDDIEVEED